MYLSGQSIAAIRRRFGSDPGTIANVLRRRGIQIRHQGFYSKGEKNGMWKGGHINKDGYRQLSVGGKMIFEHRIVMEKFLKRKLSPLEHVHHLNGQKLDNRIDNLAVLTASPHGKISSKQYHDWRKMYCDRIKELERQIADLKTLA